MKKIVLLIICLMPVSLMAQKGFIIKGQLGQLNSPEKAYLNYTIEGKAVVDSMEIKNAGFQFKGKVPCPVRAVINIKYAAETPSGKAKDMLSFYIENSDIEITSTDSIKKATVKGSVTDYENRQLQALVKPVKKQIDAITDEFLRKTPEEQSDKTYSKTAGTKITALMAEERLINMNFIAKNRTSYIALFAFNIYGLGSDFDPKTAEIEFNKFLPAIKKSMHGQKVLAKIELAKKSQLGARVKDFTQNDINGKAFTLSSLKGKYVLVDFWASWCGPCRAENPNVVKAYNQLKGKNFEIVSVSLDNSKEQWSKAIEKDGMPWIHVSDLKGWKNEVALQYGVTSVPQNFLIDPNGLVIGKNLRGDDLSKKLSSLIQ
ncbi:TlpA disulfide reductase family protein [Pedobacter frigoris]|uniref:AhpC/TSA family protein n=1 Tax=Pedobacter frigoris TaxID=2571272 RepID=A0A4U1CPH9_9SPHI|nr:TlpA disulfide reductase family protein [Pedobacter frigoris]TKC09156.1 AhpC/TSA family protein [Pedobacter frigoris]